MHRCQTKSRIIKTGSVTTLGFLLICVAYPAFAVVNGPLAASVARGKNAFIHNTFSGRGMTCQSCHTAGGKGPTVVPGRQMQAPGLTNAAAVFPRFKPRDGKVMTLEEEIHGCIQGALGGKAPAYDSKTMTDLVSYITSLSQGKQVNMGGAYK